MAMTSLAVLRDALTALGLSTSTGALRGDERRAVLEQRLRDARIKLSREVEPTREADQRKVSDDGEDRGSTTASGKSHDYRSMPLSDLRSELEARGLSTQTPGLKGDARRHALVQRLQNVGTELRGRVKAIETPEQVRILSDSEALKSSRSSVSSYSAASEFLFFDTSRADAGTAPNDGPVVPQIRLPAPSSGTSAVTARSSGLSIHVRCQLERELVDLRKQLHELRANRSRETGRRLYDAGFQADLDSLSSTMAQLEAERQRLVRVAFAHELVTTTVLSGQQAEFVQQDAIALIEKRQELGRHQIQCVKQALQLSQHDDSPESDRGSTKLEQAIRRIEMQLRQSSAGSTARSSASSSSIASASTLSGVDPRSTPVLTRCRSVPTNLFHETWQELDDNQKQQLHQELEAHKSFRIRRDRICIGKTGSLSARDQTPGAAASGCRGVLEFTRYPPTRADKLGIKALFLEHSQRSNAEIRSVYELALADEPHHAVVLGNYARFLHERRQDHAQAQRMYEQALQTDPLRASTLASYASFLHHVRHDHDYAKRLYAQALQISSDDPVLLGNYASLLRKHANGSVSELVEAKQLLLRALEVDKRNVANRLHLLKVTEDLGETAATLRGYEHLVQEVESTSASDSDPNLDLTPRRERTLDQNAHVYGNFANFLSRCSTLERAKRMYEMALRLRPDDRLLQRNFSLLLRTFNRTPRP